MVACITPNAKLLETKKMAVKSCTLQEQVGKCHQISKIFSMPSIFDCDNKIITNLE